MPAAAGRWTRCWRPATIILRNDAPSRALEGLELYVRAEKGAAARIAVEENGARYFADLGRARRPAGITTSATIAPSLPRWPRARAVLDAYCYTGGFGILAAQGGREGSIVGLDSSAPALALAEDSAAANQVSIRAVKADVFEEMERLARKRKRSTSSSPIRRLS